MNLSLPAAPIDKLAVRQIIADVDRVTIGKRRIDIAHALLTIVGHEIASKAETPGDAKRHGVMVARDLKRFVAEAFAQRDQTVKR